jgi:glycosyltransferase involved in cell wall biosynthesis
VVSTRHSGIPDVVVDGETGLLVDEGDAAAMGQMMARLALDPALAGRLGAAGRQRALALFSLEEHLRKLAEVLTAAAWRAAH